MKRFQFSIASLLGVVVAVAFGIAALRSATDAWDSGVLGITLFTLLVAVLLAVHRTDRQRAYWLGFALFGWAYLTASLIPPLEARLPTTRGLALLGSGQAGAAGRGIVAADLDNDGDVDLYLSNDAVQGKMFRNQGNVTFVDVAAQARTSGPEMFNDSTNLRRWTTLWRRAGPGGTRENLARIMHSLVALVVALVGGRLSSSLYGTNQGRRASEARTLPPSESPADSSESGRPGQQPSSTAGRARTDR